MLKDIPQSRLFLYVLILGFIPVFLALFVTSNQRSTAKELQAGVESLQTKAYISEKKQVINVAIMEHFRETDKFYIDKNLETITFLQPEIRGLTKVMGNRNFAGDEFISKRLEFLTSPENRLQFTEGPAVVYPLFQESTATLARPVQVNVEDLKQILSFVEGVTIDGYEAPPGRPQMIITDFNLSRQTVNDGNEVLSLNMKVLKREYQ